VAGIKSARQMVAASKWWPAARRGRPQGLKTLIILQGDQMALAKTDHKGRP